MGWVVSFEPQHFLLSACRALRVRLLAGEFQMRTTKWIQHYHQGREVDIAAWQDWDQEFPASSESRGAISILRYEDIDLICD
jgi:hypothetical protein